MNFDCALFDVDGVLVDIRKSYNTAIKKTVEYVLERSGKKYPNLVTDQIILKFRETGGFNNDTDTSYAIALATLVNPQKGVVKARKFLSTVAENADETGLASVEKFLAAKYDIQKFKNILAYPAPVKDSFIGRVFDELFYGPELFKKQNGLEPKYCAGKPLIEKDRLVAKRKTMEMLSKKFGGNLALVSGRSRLAAEYSLWPILRYFNISACVFLEDEAREHAKPNPYAIRKAMETMNAKTAVYAGDSAEDLLMARRAEKELGVKISFVGVYGCSPKPAKTIRKFKQGRADAIIKDVDRLPIVINTVRAKL